MHWFLKLNAFLGVAFLVWVFIFLLLPRILPEQTLSNTTVSGFVLRRQIWEGTIRVTGDLVTAPASSIVMKPGTKVLVGVAGDRFNLDYLPWHTKIGVNTKDEYHGVRTGEPFWDEKGKIQLHFSKLFAIGTREQPVVITSDSNTGSPYDINVIKVNSGVLSDLQLSNYRRLEIGKDVTVRGSILTQVGECAVCIIGGSPSVINNTFADALREYIWIQKASPRITDNTFLPSSGSGIRIDPGVQGSPVIAHNSFEMPQRDAVDIIGGGERNGGVFSHNSFSGNSAIKLPCDSKIKFEGNNILGVVYFSTGGCSGSYTFGPNYWGTQDKDAILSSKITGREKGFSVFLPFVLKSPSPWAGRR